MQFIDLQAQYQAYKEEIDRRIAAVLDSSRYVLGPEVAELEEKLASYVGVRHAVAVANGTDALMLCLLALGVKPGDEIICPSFTFMATAEVVSFLGAKPVFADIDEATYNLNPESVEAAMTERTRGVIAVDLFGQCADYDALRALTDARGVFLLEDAAQSFGARYRGRRAGSFGRAAATSFFPAKPLGCYGDGGMVFTDDDALAEAVDSLHVHGKGDDKYDNVRIGINSRLDSIQAAVLLAKFERFDEEIERRQEVARRYDEGLRDVAVVPAVRDDCLSVYAQYCVRCPDRDRVREALADAEIPSAIYYPKPLHLQQAFAYLGGKEGDLPASERVARDILALPMHPFLEPLEQERVIDVVRAACVE